MTTPQSWTAVLDALYADSWNPALRRFRSPFAFRGLGRVDHVMSSSLFRLAGGADTQRLEMALLRNFRKYAHVEQSGADSIWDWLALGQHRGLPTRLVRQLRRGQPAVATKASPDHAAQRIRDRHRRHAEFVSLALGIRRAGAFAVSRLPGTTGDRSPHSESIRAVLADVERKGDDGRLAAPASGFLPARRDSGEAEMGDPRQARSGERQRARAVPRSGWPEPVADSVLSPHRSACHNRQT